MSASLSKQEKRCCCVNTCDATRELPRSQHGAQTRGKHPLTLSQGLPEIATTKILPSASASSASGAFYLDVSAPASPYRVYYLPSRVDTTGIALAGVPR